MELTATSKAGAAFEILRKGIAKGIKGWFSKKNFKYTNIKSMKKFDAVT